MKIRLAVGIWEWAVKVAIGAVLIYRRLRYGYTFRRIALTQGKFALVDVEDYERLNKYKWYALLSKRTYYAARTEHEDTTVKMMEGLFGPVPVSSRKGRQRRSRMVMMHREIMQAEKGRLVDHRNNNGLDDRKENLRLATHKENMQNRCKPRGRSSSEYKGVWKVKRDNKWAARIRVDGKAKHLGVYHTEVEAAKAYDEAAKRYFGEFAYLNFPGPRRRRKVDGEFLLSVVSFLLSVLRFGGPAAKKGQIRR